MIKQILVSLPTFPDPAPSRMLEDVAGLAQSLGARLTAQIPQLNQDEASWPVVMGTFAADVPQMMRESVAVSERNAQAQSELLRKACVSAGVMLDIRRSVTPLYPSADALVDLARLHDLVILPVPQIEEFDRNYVAAAIFDSGRPTMLMPSGPGARPMGALNNILVAWDYSRAAARALSDAMPLLARARKVRVLSIVNDTTRRTTCTLSDLDTYLSSHKIDYTLEQRTHEEGAIAEALRAAAREIDADLLVMGAYGHSRFREFMLGGVTRDILAQQTLPVLFSH